MPISYQKIFTFIFRTDSALPLIGETENRVNYVIKLSLLVMNLEIEWFLILYFLNCSERVASEGGFVVY